MTDNTQYLHEFTADHHIVKLLTQHLLSAYDEFIDSYPGTVDYVDGFMAAHNFHRITILQLEKITNDKQKTWRNMAMATFDKAMKSPEGRGDPEP